MHLQIAACCLETKKVLYRQLDDKKPSDKLGSALYWAAVARRSL